MSKIEILRAIGNESLSLIRGPGEWCFVYENEETEVYGELYVEVAELAALPLESWIAQGRELIAAVA
jgi:hypothetical protein